MKKRVVKSVMAIFCLTLISGLQGCFKDSCRNSYTIYRPVYKKLSEVRAEMKSTVPQPLEATGKIYTYGSYLFVNEPQKGLHIIDNTHPETPRNIGFVNIPGNVDIAVKGNYLYADSYSDVVVFDISNPQTTQPVKFLNNVFKESNRFWANQTNPDSVLIIAGYTKKDTTVDCSFDNNYFASTCPGCLFYDGRLTASSTPSVPGGTGTAGSMARFSLVNNFLYGVSFSSLYSLDISTPSQPSLVSTKNLGWGIETIYPFQNYLFIGSTTGMFIYDITNPSDPVKTGQFGHVRSCDPVITDGRFAYVTLHSGSACGGFTNQLDVLKLDNLSSPSLIKTYNLTSPYGLAKDGDLLFICDGKDGLKIYNAADPANLGEIKTFRGMETYDVIADKGNAIVVATDGIYQYDYSNTSNIHLISKLPINK